MRECFPLYRHARMYHQHEDFKKFKFVDKAEWKKLTAQKEKVMSLINKGRDEVLIDTDSKFEEQLQNFRCNGECADEPCPVPAEIDNEPSSRDFHDYAQRYTMIAMKGYFANNLAFFDAMLESCKSFSQFKMKCAMKGIEDRDMRFAVCCLLLNVQNRYNWYDFSKLGKKTLDKLIASIQRGSSSKLDEFVKFSILVEGYEEACKKTSDVSRFEDFASRPLYK